MNVITEIRDYVKLMIREVSPRMRPSDIPHTPDTIGGFQFDESYYLRFLTIPVAQQQSVHEYSIPVEIELGKKAGADAIKAHDDILCEAIEISSKLPAKKNYLEKFANVEVTSVFPDAVLDNERWTKVTISANFLVYIEDDNA